MKHHLRLAVANTDRSDAELVELLRSSAKVSAVVRPDFSMEMAHRSSGPGDPVVYLNLDVVAEGEDELKEIVIGIQAVMLEGGITISEPCRVLSSQPVEPARIHAPGVGYDETRDLLIVDPSSRGFDDVEMMLMCRDDGRTTVIIKSGRPGTRRKDAVAVKGIVVRKLR